MSKKRKLEKLDLRKPGADLKLRNLSVPGVYSTTEMGLYFRVTDTKAKNWIYRFMLNGRARWMGLGSYPDVPLAGRIEGSGETIKGACDLATEARRKTRAGIDPIGERSAGKIKARVHAAKSTTFLECADAYIEAKRAEWKNPKHVQQWTNTLATYCGPVFGKLPVSEVDTALIMKALQPIWATKTETADRVRGRIEAVLGWATVREFRHGDNPARWKNHLDKMLPAPGKVTPTVHHAALPFAEMGTFVAALRQQEGMGASALEFTILTACRSGEVRGAVWGEFDLDARVWVIPAARMKAKKEHRVPLSKAAMKVLARMQAEQRGDLVFPGRDEGKPISDMTMTAVLRRMNRGDLTTHGFRSTFRDWVSESTAYPRDVAEMALAHTIGDKVEAAYRRGDLFAKRVRMMDDWAKYCATVQGDTANVVPLKKGKAAA